MGVGDNATGAGDQQERPEERARSPPPESSETIRQTSVNEEDIVRPAWRQAEWVANPTPWQQGVTQRTVLR